MAWAVFLRGVNVGGSKRYKPSQLADELDDLEVTNIGAAGTYVVQGTDDPGVVRDRVQETLPFETEVFIRPGHRVLDLLEEDALGTAELPDGTKAYLTALAEPPSGSPDLPVDRPAGADRQFRLVEVREDDALCLRRPDKPGRFYPNTVIEDLLGVPATTRGWATVERLGRVLSEA